MAKPKKKVIDWETVEKEYRAGQLSIRAIASNHGITDTAIRKKAAEKGWSRDLSDQVREKVRADLVRGEVCTTHGREPEIVQAAAARGVEVIQNHRRHLARLARIADEMMARVEMVLGLREMDGNPRMAFGEKESPADVMEKVSRTLHRAIPLERQAFNLDEPGAKDNATTLSAEQVRRMAAEVAAQE